MVNDQVKQLARELDDMLNKEGFTANEEYKQKQEHFFELLSVPPIRIETVAIEFGEDGISR